MLDFKFNFCYQDEKTPALSNVAEQIEHGKCIVLCGGSGCGKSTLLRCLNHLIPQFYEGELKGFCYIQGKDTAELSIGEVGELAASVFQDPRSQFFTINSSTEVAFGLENHGVSKDKITHRVNEAFELFSLEKLKNRNVYELSSGERQLVSILSAWAMDTDILLLDEPTANLDIAATEQLQGLLLKLKQQGKTLILSEHRLYYLSEIADEFWLMEDGQLLGRYTAEQIMKRSMENAAALPLRTLDLGNITLSTEIMTETPAFPSFTFSVSDLRFGYRKKGEELLQGVSLNAHCGEVVGLIGANGSGKTTLGKLMTGLLWQSAGDILYNGKRVGGKELEKSTLFVMQEAEFQFFTNSVINELKYGHKDTPEFQAEVERLLKKFGMWECRNRHPFSLSGGQMQKLSLMIAALSPKRIVVLDEPTAGLDMQSLRSCSELIREMQGEKLVFVITHDMELIAQVCTRCICISEGIVEREIVLSDEAQLKKLMKYMENSIRVQHDAHFTAADNRECRLHPIIKLLFWMATLVSVSTADNAFMFSVYTGLILMIFVDGWYSMALMGGGLIALLFGLNGLFSHTAVSFALVFFPRILAVWLSMNMLIGRNEASRTIATLRMVHIPEKLIMICSVVFRFFPVLSGDMKLMRQSIRTRGAFTTFGQKLRSLSEYLEILTIPMALRVIRIAETLSASAETRGIALKRKRNSYVSLHYSAWDLVFLILLLAAVVVGITI